MPGVYYKLLKMIFKRKLKMSERKNNSDKTIPSIASVRTMYSKCFIPKASVAYCLLETLYRSKRDNTLKNIVLVRLGVKREGRWKPFKYIQLVWYSGG